MSALPFCTSIACVVDVAVAEHDAVERCRDGPTYSALAATIVSLVVLKLSSMYGPDPADVELRNSSAVSSASAPG